MATTKKSAKSFQIQYRQGGMWVNGNVYPTRKQAEDYARNTGRDYQVVEKV